MTNPLDKAPLCIIQAGKQKSLDLARAVIRGCGGGDYHYGDIHPDAIPEGYIPVVIGVHPTTVDTLHALKRAREPFVTVDNGYFRPYKEGGYFRATTNALQWVARSPLGDFWKFRRPVDPAIGKPRWEALGIDLEPYSTFNRESVLVALQSPVWLDMMGEEPDWLEKTTREIKKHSRRPIVIRHKPLKGAPPQPPLEEQIAQSWAVVAYSSAVLLKALIAGVPVFTAQDCAASPLAKRALWSIDNPTRPPREAVFYDLAANQWTLEEITSGRMWSDLRDRYEPEFFPLA